MCSVDCLCCCGAFDCIYLINNCTYDCGDSEYDSCASYNCNHNSILCLWLITVERCVRAPLTVCVVVFVV